ncbi:GNAT family N-acetyltransferase [Streptomyces sp. NPDC055051]
MRETGRSWVEGWAVARRVAAPVEVPWGLRVEVGQPTQVVRHVLLGADDAAVRGLIGAVAEPTTCVKAFMTSEAMRPWFTSAWEPVEPCFLMAAPLRPARVRAPEGYAVDVEVAGGVASVRVHSAGGEPAAAGIAGLAGDVCVFDRIVTEPAHRRLGLGTLVMGALTGAAVERGAASGLLAATAPGRALYETLGWRVLAPLNGFVYRPQVC